MTTLPRGEATDGVVLAPVLRLRGRPLPLVGPARMYVCGVTPYDVTHLGHAATFVWTDVAARVLRRLGVEVSVTRNITDVDDVLTAAARRADTPYDELAAMQAFQFDRDMAALRVGRPQREPRAHSHIDQVVRLAAALLELGAAYESGGTVYFRGADVPVRAGLSAEEARAACAEYGEQPDDPRKESPFDVPVWRASTEPDEPAWPSPWGAGRPGWHAECTAMVLCDVGPVVDLHAGGADLVFPHHAYETAMAEAVTGVRPFARAWLHVGTVRLGGAKMAKSTGRLVLVADLLRDHRPAAVRLLLLDRPWAAPWDYDPVALTGAEQRLDELHSAAGRPGGDGAADHEVTRALVADLDVPRALAVALESGGAAARGLLRTLALD